MKYWSTSGSSNKTDGKAIPVKHDTDATYRVMSLHSFSNQKDYYIITTDAITRPVDLWICAPKGGTRGELEGGDPGLSYYYDLIFGGNRGLSTKVWSSVKEANLEKYMPNRTVNKETQVSDSSAFNIGGGVSLGGGGGKNWNGGEKTPIGQGNLEASFNWGISHRSSKTWTTNDYEIVPNITLDNGNGLKVAQWDLLCTWPEYSDKTDSWTVSSAFKDNVSFSTESIWSVPSSKRNETAFYGQNLWIHGFCWAHDMPSQKVKSFNAEVQHEGIVKQLELPRPPLLGIGSATTTGNKNAKMYTAKILSENDWTATSDSDWLEVIHTSGGATGKDGTDFSYTVTENNTGQPRIGTITAKSGTYVARIKFVQSPDEN